MRKVKLKDLHKENCFFRVGPEEVEEIKKYIKKQTGIPWVLGGVVPRYIYKRANRYTWSNTRSTPTELEEVKLVVKKPLRKVKLADLGKEKGCYFKLTKKNKEAVKEYVCSIGGLRDKQHCEIMKYTAIVYGNWLYSTKLPTIPLEKVKVVLPKKEPREVDLLNLVNEDKPITFTLYEKNYVEFLRAAGRNPYVAASLPKGSVVVYSPEYKRYIFNHKCDFKAEEVILKFPTKEKTQDFASQQDLVKWLCQGGEIRGKYSGSLVKFEAGNLCIDKELYKGILSMPPAWEKVIPTKEETPWYKNIPEKGILCWVYKAGTKSPAMVREYKFDDCGKVCFAIGEGWVRVENLTPLTLEEVKEFIYDAK